MPPRSVKMKRFIFGFQRRVWCPKCTPASSRSFMETTGMSAPFSVAVAVRRRRFGGDRGVRPPSTCPFAGSEFWTGSWYRVAEARQIGREVGRQGRFDGDLLAGEGVREGESRRVQELASEARLGSAVSGIADHREVDRSEVDADLVHAPRLEPDAEERMSR